MYGLEYDFFGVEFVKVIFMFVKEFVICEMYDLLGNIGLDFD